MRTPLRRRVIVPSVVAVVVVAVAAGTAWSLLSDGRRMGRAAERLLTSRTALSITVERAWYRPGRFRLRGVHVAPGPAFPLDVRVGELDIAAGVMNLVAPAGHTVSLVATSASIAVAESPAPASGTGGIEALRRRILAFLEWPGRLTIRVQGGELGTPAGMVRFDLSGEKTAQGLTLAVSPEGEGESARVGIRAAAALGQALDLVVDVAGLPRVLAAVWPGAAPPASSFAARAQLQLLAGGVVSSLGRVTLGTGAKDGAVLNFTSRYDSATGELAISRYALAWGDDVRVQGTARLAPEAAGRRLSATAAGHAAGSAVSGRGSYDVGSGALEAEATLGLRADFSVDASVSATLTLARGAEGLRLSGIEGGKLALSREGRPLLVATGVDVRPDAPVTVGVTGDPPPGSLSVARVFACGLAVEGVTGQVRHTDHRLLLSALRYTQYGGKGTGWLEVARGETSPPFRARLEAEGVAGRVRYRATAQYLHGRGLVADARIESEDGGGEVAVEALGVLTARGAPATGFPCEAATHR